MDSLLERRIKHKSRKLRPKMLLTSMSHDELRHRTTSLMWEAENDPFQVFEVEHDSCLDLEIMVTKGEDITKGSSYQDLCDTPDPYVVLRVPGSSNSSKRTSHIDNTIHPIWNETFHFFLDPKKQHSLHISLMDANFIMSDELLGENLLDINSLPLDDPREFIVEFPSGSKIHMKLRLQKDKNPDLRFSLALCEEEKTFLRLRRHKVMGNMQKLLGDKGPQMEGEVPIIGILGSGGGFRAMTCLSGAVKALHQSGIFGCATYITGLSGSSWLISTLYSHDKFPNITYDEIYEELQKSVTQNWKWNLAHSYRYIFDMMRKYRGGQPISFTDVFGHLLGDVLMPGQKHKMLSDQKEVVAKGNVPFPLYTCLHAKASVSCKAFSEWIEFSPYEIGIAKYGTFMKTEDFGSKFIVGKIIKKYPEFPLHYLQGVWGSAFTILVRRLALSGGTKKDLVQIMRDANEERAINEQLEEEYLNQHSEESPHEKESETDDEADIEGADDRLSEEDDSNEQKDIKEKIEEMNREISLEGLNIAGSLDSKQKDNDSSQEAGNGRAPKLKLQRFSFETLKSSPLKSGRKNSKDETNERKISTQSDPGISVQSILKTNKPKIKRQGAIREGSIGINTNQTPAQASAHTYWQKKKEMRKSTRTKQSSVIQELMKNSNLLNSRAGRAGEILNPFRGLSLKHAFPLSPFESTSIEDEEGIDELDLGLGSRYESLDNKAKKLFIVDSGLAFNSPYPLLLRPQRAVDIYISFDFSQRPLDSNMPFKELLIAEKWAKQNKVLFPPIEKQAAKYAEDKEVKELYIFRNDDDPRCPVILHFTIVNNKFKWEKAPGVPRETKEELDFADFSLFDEPSQPYASTNFVYEPVQYERLVKLIEYNTLLKIETIKGVIAEVVENKRHQAIAPLDQTFLRVQKVMSICKKFKSSKDLHLKVDEKEGQRFINRWRRKKVSVGSTLSSSCEEFKFFDAPESLDSCEEESDYESGEENVQL